MSLALSAAPTWELLAELRARAALSHYTVAELPPALPGKPPLYGIGNDGAITHGPRGPMPVYVAHCRERADAENIAALLNAQTELRREAHDA